MPFSLLSKRLRIRQFESGDIEPFIDFMTDPDSTQFLTFDDEQKSRAGATELLEITIASYDSESPLMAFAVDNQKTNEFVGFCGLTPREEGAAEIMYAVMPKACGQGYATEIAATLAQHAVSQLGYHRVIAPISVGHEPSKSVAIKAGFKSQGIRQHPDSADELELFVFELE